MLTVTHPEIIHLLDSFSFGLFPFKLPTEDRWTIVVKATKEMILTAKLNKEIKIYVVPSSKNLSNSCGLVTAFFDDPDEPLILLTPLVSETLAPDLVRAILTETVKFHFIDENSREMLGYVSTIDCPSITQKRLYDLSLLANTNANSRDSHDQMNSWFSTRTASDDRYSIAVKFGELLFPENTYILDATPDYQEFNGAKGVSTAQLVRQEPGFFQEIDIINLLSRIFPQDTIYHGPLRPGKKEEIVDVLVITDRNALFIQAKDSPNTESIINNLISRKKSTTRKSIDKASNQIKGAIRYAESHSPMEIMLEGKTSEIELSNLDVYCLIIVKELFRDEYKSYSDRILLLTESISKPCLVMGFDELVAERVNLIWTLS